TFAVEIGGTAAGQYDQVKVTGTVTVDGSLSITTVNGFATGAGQRFTLIDNDGSDAVTGAFTGLAEGDTVSLGGVDFTISYAGGDGNDVTLRSADPPAAPDSSDSGKAGTIPSADNDELVVPAVGGSV